MYIAGMKPGALLEELTRRQRERARLDKEIAALEDRLKRAIPEGEDLHVLLGATHDPALYCVFQCEGVLYVDPLKSIWGYQWEWPVPEEASRAVDAAVEAPSIEGEEAPAADYTLHAVDESA